MIRSGQTIYVPWNNIRKDNYSINEFMVWSIIVMWLASLILQAIGLGFSDVFMIAPLSFFPVHMKYRFPLTRNIYDTLFGVSLKSNSIISFLLLIFVVCFQILIILALRIWL